MTERPILFSAPMVRAILEGRKTCTRRVLKPQPYSAQSTAFYDAESNSWMSTEPSPITGGTRQMDPWRKIKFAVGDTLWVREAWRADSSHDRTKPSDLDDMTSQISYEADELIGESGKLRPSMFMPRWMSRTTLRVTSIKVERLQDISEANCIAEGIFHKDYGRRCFHGGGQIRDAKECSAPFNSHPIREGWNWHESKTHEECWPLPKVAFINLWESINGAGSFDQNPWVVAIGFEVVK